MADIDKTLDEIKRRVIRTETRVMALGSKLGFDLKEEEEITVVKESRSVYIAVLDVAFTTIIRRCRQEDMRGAVNVFYNGAPIGIVNV